VLEKLEDRLAPANVDILSGHYDLQLHAQNLNETTLTPANVNATNFGMLANISIDGQAYAQPLYKHGLMINGTPHDVAFVATEHDSVYAFDIVTNPTTGAVTISQLWHNSYIDPANGITTTPYQELSTPDLFPEIGITGTPVIDGGTNTLYIVVKTREVRSDGGVHYVQKLHALDLATGAEKFGGPYQIGDTHVATAGATPVFANENTAIMVPGTGSESSGGTNSMVPFSAMKENDRMSMQLVGNIVYVAFASHADFRPYHGWVIGFDKTTLQPVKVFNTAPNADGVAIWESGGGLSFDAQGFMYFATGNGFTTGNGFAAYDPAHGNYSESVIKLDTTPTWSTSNPGNMMTVVDYFTPFNWQTLDSQDADLGSGGVMLLPDGVGSAAHQHLLIETGKQGRIYLIDRDNMGKLNNQGTGPDLVVQTVTAGQTGVWGNPAFFQVNATTGIIYYHGSGDVLKGYYITNGHIEDGSQTGDRAILKSSFNSKFPGTQPSLSGDGTADPLNPVNGIVWELQVDNAVGRIQGVADFTSAGPVTLRAFSATNFSTELYDSSQVGQRDFATGSVKFTVPVVTNGHVLVAGADHFAVFGLFPTETAVPAAPSNLSAMIQATSQGSQVVLNWTNPPSNPGSDPTGIEIFRSTDGVNFTLLSTVNRNQTTFTDTGPFQFGQAYYYQVKAVNQVGESGPSNTVSIVAPIPSSVLFITGTGASSIYLAWTNVPADYYVIERSTDGVHFSPIATTSIFQWSYTDTGLSPGLYTYRIHAFTNAGGESLSTAKGAWVGSMIDHGTPATGGFNNATDLTTNGSAFVGANVLELTSGNNQAGSAFSNTRITDANFTTTFDVRLHEGTQPNYADGFAFVLQAKSPTALGSAAAGIGYQGIGNSVAVVFSTFQHSGDPSNSSVGLALNGAAPSSRVNTIPSGLLLNSQDAKQIDLTYDGTTLTVRIQDILQPQLVFTTSFAVNITQVIGSDTAYVGLTGSSGSSNFWELEDVLSWKYTSQVTVPGGPTNLQAGTPPDGGVELVWNSNSFNETGFRIERAPAEGGAFTEIATVGQVTTYTDTSIPAGAYLYRVRAYNNAGNSFYSNSVLVSYLIPDAPIALKVTSATSTGVSLSWYEYDPSTTGYQIERSTDGTNFTVVGAVSDPNTYTFTDTTITPPNSYFYRVRALNSNGASLPSSTVQATLQLRTQPVLYFRFDETSGTTTQDHSGLNNNGTLVGGVTHVGGLPGFGNGLHFDSTGYVTAADATSLDPQFQITVSAWINADTWSGGNRRILQKGNSDNQYRLLEEGGVLKWDLAGIGTVTAALPSTGVWHNVTGTYDGKTIVLYVDGTAVASQAASGQLAVTSDPLTVATKNGTATTGDNFIGTIDEVRVYQRALSAAEVKLLPFTDTDVGNVAAAGSASISSGSVSGGNAVYAIAGSGDDIWNNADAFNFFYQPLHGNAVITARVTSVTLTDYWAKGVIMFRQTLDAGSSFVDLVLTHTDPNPSLDHSETSLQWRQTPNGGPAAADQGPGSAPLPYWIRLTRNGNLFTAEKSSDGVTWVQVATQTTPMNTDIFVGLGVTAHNNSGVLNTSFFDHVSIVDGPEGGEPVLPPWSPDTVSSSGAPLDISFAAAATPTSGESGLPSLASLGSSTTVATITPPAGANGPALLLGALNAPADSGLSGNQLPVSLPEENLTLASAPVIAATLTSPNTLTSDVADAVFAATQQDVPTNALDEVFAQGLGDAL
jgi:hypothetical protein